MYISIEKFIGAGFLSYMVVRIYICYISSIHESTCKNKSFISIFSLWYNNILLIYIKKLKNGL
jgi:hypothetical protein